MHSVIKGTVKGGEKKKDESEKKGKTNWSNSLDHEKVCTKAGVGETEDLYFTDTVLSLTVYKGNFLC